MTAETRSLHRKLAQIMYEAERIPKRGRAPAAMGGFEFVQVGDAADFIRKALAEKVISMLPTKVTIVGQNEHTTKSGGSMTTVDLLTEWTLTDGESGESIVIQSFGAGADGGDKYSGKAQTNAMKYALLMGFLLSTGDDPELSDSSDRRRPPAGVEDDAESGTETTHGKETEELIGTLRKSGTVRKGTAQGYQLDARETPDGTHAIGFRLELPDDRDIPQVLLEGPVGEAAYLATAGKPAELVGAKVAVKGRLYNVKFPGRKSYYRLRVLEIEAPEFRYPASEDEPPPIAEGQEPLGLDSEDAAAVDEAMDAALVKP